MTNKKDKIIFVYPYEQQEGAINNASKIRPYMMELAFKEAFGKNLLIRNGKQRFKNIPQNGVKGLYLESINRPFFIQRIIEKDWRIFSDYWNLWRLKKRGIKLSVFYRDAFWAGDFLFENYFFLVALLLKGCFKLEWILFNKIFDIIYLPSLELADFMGEKERSKYEVLLPGCDTPKINEISPLAPKKNIQSKITSRIQL